MTLKELKKMTVEPEKQYTYKTLLQGLSGTFRILEKRIVEGTEIIALENGYVLYQSDGRVTAFTLDDCRGCRYFMANGEHVDIPEEDLEEMEWTIPALLIGEKRIMNNRVNDRDRYEISATEGDEERGEKQNILERFLSNSSEMTTEEEVLAEQHFEYMMSFLTPSQGKIARMIYKENRSLKEISELTETDYRAVRRTHQRILERLRENMGQKNF